MDLRGCRRRSAGSGLGGIVAGVVVAEGNRRGGGRDGRGSCHQAQRCSEEERDDCRQPTGHGFSLSRAGKVALCRLGKRALARARCRALAEIHPDCKGVHAFVPTCCNSRSCRRSHIGDRFFSARRGSSPASGEAGARHDRAGQGPVVRHALADRRGRHPSRGDRPRERLRDRPPRGPRPQRLGPRRRRQGDRPRPQRVRPTRLERDRDDRRPQGPGPADSELPPDGRRQDRDPERPVHQGEHRDERQGQLVRVALRTDFDREALATLNLDGTDHPTPNYQDVLLHGAADEASFRSPTSPTARARATCSPRTAPTGGPTRAGPQRAGPRRGARRDAGRSHELPHAPRDRAGAEGHGGRQPRPRPHVRAPAQVDRGPRHHGHRDRPERDEPAGRAPGVRDGGHAPRSRVARQ